MRRLPAILFTLLLGCSGPNQERQTAYVHTHYKIESGIQFDYSGAEMVLTHFADSTHNKQQEILNHSGYKHLLAYSQRFSSNPITSEDLLMALQGEPGKFNFTRIPNRTDTLQDILQFLKSRERQIREEFSKLPLRYLPEEYEENTTIYYVIGGYNGIAFNDKVCVNIDYQQFRKNPNEILLYKAHELFHIGFEKYHPIPDIFAAKTVAYLRDIVLTMTMNEGLATLTPYQKRIELNELSDYDYEILLDPAALNAKVRQFNTVMQYLDLNINQELTNAILGTVLGQCSSDRLFLCSRL